MLLQRWMQGDQAAWDAIIPLHRWKVYHVAYTFVGRDEEAEDLAQAIGRSCPTSDR